MRTLLQLTMIAAGFALTLAIFFCMIPLLAAARPLAGEIFGAGSVATLGLSFVLPLAVLALALLLGWGAVAVVARCLGWRDVRG